MALQFTTSLTATSSAGFGGYVPFVVPGATGISLKATYVKITNTGTSDGLWVNMGSTVSTTTALCIVAGTTAAFSITAQPGRFFEGFSYTTTALTSIPFTVLAIR